MQKCIGFLPPKNCFEGERLEHNGDIGAAISSVEIRLKLSVVSIGSRKPSYHDSATMAEDFKEAEEVARRIRNNTPFMDSATKIVLIENLIRTDGISGHKASYFPSNKAKCSRLTPFRQPQGTGKDVHIRSRNCERLRRLTLSQLLT